MTPRNHILRAAATLAVLGAFLNGCGKEEPPPPPPPSKPAYTPPPPPPEPVNVDVLAQSMSVDARVQFPENHAPMDEGFARAVITLADSLAKGDDSAMRDVLSQPAQASLDELLGNGGWYDATDVIEVVRVVELNEGMQTVTLAVQDPDGAYPLRWEGAKLGGSVKFTGVPVHDVVLRRASDFDGGVPEPERVATAAPDDEAKAEGDDASSDGFEPVEDDDGPTIKQTPGGPVEIPRDRRPPPP